MDVDITPAVESSERRALLVALEQEDAWGRGEPYREAWRLAGMREASEGDEAEVGYAFSPRRTRGATRA